MRKNRLNLTNAEMVETSAAQIRSTCLLGLHISDNIDRGGGVVLPDIRRGEPALGTEPARPRETMSPRKL